MEIYKVKQEDLIGQIKDFPIEVVQKMVDYQVEQGNQPDVTVFQNKVSSNKYGFSWCQSKEGLGFWLDVIIDHDFDFFFEKYPKQWMPKKGEMVLASDNEDNWYEGIFLAYIEEANKPYITTYFKEDEKNYKRGGKVNVTNWYYCKPKDAIK